MAALPYCILRNQTFFKWDVSFIYLFMHLFKIWTPWTLNNICVSGCMYHPAELYSGRNTWGSYPAGGPNRGQWAPVNSRPWSHTQRSAAPSYALTDTCFYSVTFYWDINPFAGAHFRCSGLLCSIVFSHFLTDHALMIFSRQQPRLPMRLQ